MRKFEPTHWRPYGSSHAKRAPISVYKHQFLMAYIQRWIRFACCLLAHSQCCWVVSECCCSERFFSFCSIKDKGMNVEKSLKYYPMASGWAIGVIWQIHGLFTADKMNRYYNFPSSTILLPERNANRDTKKSLFLFFALSLLFLPLLNFRFKSIIPFCSRTDPKEAVVISSRSYSQGLMTLSLSW